MAIRCTQAVLKAMGGKAPALASLDPDPDDIYVTLFEADRKKCIIAMHAQTLLAVTMRDVRTAQLRNLGAVLGSEFERLLRDMVMPVDLVTVNPSAQLAGAHNRDLLARLDEIAYTVADRLSDGYAMDVDLAALNLEMQEVGYLGPGADTPRSRLTARWERRVMAG